MEASLQRLEDLMGKKFGDPGDSLLVSVRSGAASSMPGMMDTVLNLELNDVTVKGFIEKTRESALPMTATVGSSPCTGMS